MNSTRTGNGAPKPGNPIDWLIWQCLRNPLLVILGLVFITGWGLAVAPFNWPLQWLPRDPVPVDAIPDLGENQQIVFTEWAGRSPQDVEDQITYPLTVSLLGIPGVKSVRSQSMFGFSSINVIFNEDIEFYWSRSRILEKLNSLPQGTLPDGVAPSLGPDATALGQVFWYTLEGRDPDGNPVGGWAPQELRSVQDWTVRYALASAEGVSEVASIGGFVQEYQVDVDPDAMRAARVTLQEIFAAVKDSNLDVGARTIEVNRVEYVIRGLGFIEDLDDIRTTVVASRDNVPIYIDDIATVSRGPALRRGALDKGGAEATGGVVVVRYGANPLAVIDNVKAKIAEIAPGLPSRARIRQDLVSGATVRTFAEEHGFSAYEEGVLNQEAWLSWLRDTSREEWPEWITTSKVTVVPFYDRTGLIQETLGTLESAITQQILVTVIVVLVMVMHLRASVLISATLPLAVLISFILMRHFNVTANIVALSGIAIAIGTVVDMGVILCENILRHLGAADGKANRLHVIYEASSEVGLAVLTAIATTVVSFLPVFTMIGAEGKLFTPLAYTKTFALLASVFLAITVLPTLAYLLLVPRVRMRWVKTILLVGVVFLGPVIGVYTRWWLGGIVMLIGIYHLVRPYLPDIVGRVAAVGISIVAAVIVTVVLATTWLPLGPRPGLFVNFLFVAGTVGGLLLLFQIFQWFYPFILRFFLRFKVVYLVFPAFILVFGALVWLGAGNVLGFVPEPLRQTAAWSKLAHAFPGLGREFMPPLDEGSFLYMPTTMPHASIGEVLDVMSKQDRAFSAIPEVDQVVGKLGRVDSPLDPAPISMLETVINYKPEYAVDENGRRRYFKFDYAAKDFVRDEDGALIPDPDGLPYRQWRDHIRTPDDIWEEIVAAGEIPGTTSAPKLQPIITRIVMLQSGMRAPLGVKVRGPDLDTIEQVAIEIESMLQEVPGVAAETVFAERIVGKPYLEIAIDRERIARYGISIRDVQDVIEVAIGGRAITTTVEGRERYPVRVRYQRELRDDIESLGEILVAGIKGQQIPIGQLADFRYVRGPQSIRSEESFLVGYITFDKQDGFAEVDVVERCQQVLRDTIASGEWALPEGVSYTFAGNYQNQLRAQKTLAVVLPLSLLFIFVILYLQFRSAITTSLVFIGIGVAWGGRFPAHLVLWPAVVSGLQRDGYEHAGSDPGPADPAQCGHMGWLPGPFRYSLG